MTSPRTTRRATVERNTKETQIRVELDLDGSGRGTFASGVGFFDHMLDQIARHGMLDLVVEAKGDLHIDGHHTVEDIGITLGQAFAQGCWATRREYAATAMPTFPSMRPCRAWSLTSRAGPDSNGTCRSSAR